MTSSVTVAIFGAVPTTLRLPDLSKSTDGLTLCDSGIRRLNFCFERSGGLWEFITNQSARLLDGESNQPHRLGDDEMSSEACHDVYPPGDMLRRVKGCAQREGEAVIWGCEVVQATFATRGPSGKPNEAKSNIDHVQVTCVSALLLASLHESESGFGLL